MYLGSSLTNSGVQSSIQGFKSVGEDKDKILSGYKSSLLIHPRWYKLFFGISRIGDLSQAPTRGEQHDARDAIRLYKGTVWEGLFEFCDANLFERKPKKRELKVVERAATVQSAMLLKSHISTLVKMIVASERLITAVPVRIVPRLLRPSRVVGVVFSPSGISWST